jgi:heme/copper-type cytochrome/quinol oxidase subunit 4
VLFTISLARRAHASRPFFIVVMAAVRMLFSMIVFFMHLAWARAGHASVFIFIVHIFELVNFF